MSGVLCCGNLVLDILIRPVDAFPWGTTTLVESIEQHLGGKCPAFKVPVVDTTGAGDCFSGAFLAALQRGRSLPDAARFANAVGALAIQQLGAVEGVRSFKETEEWMQLT